MFDIYEHALIQNNRPVIDSINIILVKKQSRYQLFDFSTLYTKTSKDKVLAVLNLIVEITFRGITRNKICVLYNNAYWIKNSKLNGNPLASLKQGVKYLKTVFLGMYTDL